MTDFVKCPHCGGVIGLMKGAMPAQGADDLDDLFLSVRTAKCLRKIGVTTIRQALALTDNELLAVDNFGRKSLRELRVQLHEWCRSKGYTCGGFLAADEAP